MIVAKQHILSLQILKLLINNILRNEKIVLFSVVCDSYDGIFWSVLPSCMDYK